MYSVSETWLQSTGSMILTVKTKVLGAKPVPVPLCWPQILQETGLGSNLDLWYRPVTNQWCHSRARSTGQWQCKQTVRQTDSNHHTAHSSYRSNCSTPQCAHMNTKQCVQKVAGDKSNTDFEKGADYRHATITTVKPVSVCVQCSTPCAHWKVTGISWVLEGPTVVQFVAHRCSLK
jgi:hypothetical protein